MKKKFLLSALFWSIIMVIGQIFGMSFAMIQYYIENPKFLDEFMTADVISLVSQFTNSMLIGGTIAVLIAVIIRVSAIKNDKKTWTQKLRDYLSLHPLQKKTDYVQFFCFGILINIVLSLILTWIYSMFSLEDNTANLFSSSILTLICVSFLVPIAEEILYRNRIYISLKNLCPKYANVIQALIFGISHGNLIQGLYTFGFGYIFGIVDDKNKSLLPSICIHCGINFYAGITILSPGAEKYLIVLGLLGIPKIISWIKNKEIK